MKGETKVSPGAKDPGQKEAQKSGSGSLIGELVLVTISKSMHYLLNID